MTDFYLGGFMVLGGLLYMSLMMLLLGGRR